MARRSAANPESGPARTGLVVDVHVDQTTFLTALARLAGVDADLVADMPDRLDRDADDAVAAAQQRFCETASGTTVPPGDMILAALAGRVRRVLYDDQGRVVDHGRTRRLFTGALRDAIVARSRVCAAPACDVAAHRCEIDHRRPWEAGGATDTDNGQPACDHHNRFKHRHPDLWRRLLDEDRDRRRGSGTPDDPRRPPPRDPPG